MSDTSTEAVSKLVEDAMHDGLEDYGLAMHHLLAERDTLAAQLAEAQSKLELSELMAKEVGVLARNAALDEARDLCTFLIGQITHYGPEPYQICAAHIEALKSEPAPRAVSVQEAAHRTGDLSALQEQNKALAEHLRAALRWIDAVPSDCALPTMPGFDRDDADDALASTNQEGGE